MAPPPPPTNACYCYRYCYSRPVASSFQSFQSLQSFQSFQRRRRMRIGSRMETGQPRRQRQRLLLSAAALASALRHAKSPDDVAQRLCDLDLDLHLPPPLPLCISAVKHLGAARRLDAAFALVDYCLLRHRSSPSPSSSDCDSASAAVSLYNALLAAVGLSGLFSRAALVLDAMRSRGLRPDVVTFNSLLSLRLRQGRPRDALPLLAQLLRAGLAPSPATFSSLLSACALLGDAPRALRLFRHCRDRCQMAGPRYDWPAELPRLQQSTLRICLSFMRRRLALPLQPERSAAEVLRFLASIDRADVPLDRRFFEPLLWACTRPEHYPLNPEP